ncbi:MAG: tRNA lysidine(34) synthetase TilS [Pseudomonadota bacterium]
MIDLLESWWRNHLNNYGENCSLKLFLGLSGGMDSTVLVAATAQWLKHRQLLDIKIQKKYPSPIQMSVIHVNHGLHVQADDWSKKSENLAFQCNFEYHYVRVSFNTKKNLEAAARQARWNVFRSILKANDVLWLAHHQRDQAETFLLRLMRGSGVIGLGAMHSTRQDQKWFVGRPLLPANYTHLKNYALENKLEWSEDPSNNNTEFDRNFIRQTILPLLESRWNVSAQRIADSAELLQDAAQVCQDQAKSDLKNVLNSVWHSRGFIVWQQTYFLTLSSARQKNILYQQLTLLNEKATDTFICSVDKVWQQLHYNFMYAASDRHPKIDLGQWEIWRYRKQWFFINKSWYEKIISNQIKLHLTSDIIKSDTSIQINFPHAYVQFDLNDLFMNEIAMNYVWGFSSQKTQFILDANGQKARYSTFWQSRGIPAWLRKYWPVLFHKDDSTTAIFIPEIYHNAFTVMQKIIPKNAKIVFIDT